MQEIERAIWSPAQQKLGERIAGHRFEWAEHALDFTRRLAHDPGWSFDFPRGAVCEYRRFCFLAMVSAQPVTSSEDVDEVWHRHVTHSRDYRDLWCGQVLRGLLHHDPTFAEPAERCRYRAQYGDTLALYERYFGPPDLRFWPAAHGPFCAQPCYRVVAGDRVVVLPRPALPGGLAWIGAMLAQSRFRKSAVRFSDMNPRQSITVSGRSIGSAMHVGLALVSLVAVPQPARSHLLNPLDWTAESFLTLYVTLVAAAFVFAIVQDRRLRRSDGGVPSEYDLHLLELAWLAGGRERAASTVILALLDAGAARLLPPVALGGLRGVPQLDVDDREAVLPPPFDAYRGAVRGAVTLDRGIALLAPRLEPTRKVLVRLRLIPSKETITQMRRLVLFVFGTVVVLGLARVAVGLSRDKPAGFLIVLIVLTVAIGFLFFIAQAHPRRTALGDVMLERTRQRHVHTTSSPPERELLLAYALYGPAVLAGTHLAEFQHLQRSLGSGCGRGSSSGDGGGTGCGVGGD